MRIICAALLLLGGLSACDRQSGAPEQAAANSQTTANDASAITSDEVQPEAKPEAAAGAKQSWTVDRSKAGEKMPDFTFAAPDGGDATLQDFAGRPVLVNLWATWCAPCVAEMPALDGVAGDYAAKGLAVLTISQDSQGAKRVNPYFAAKRFQHLKPWLDPENRFGFHYATGMLPTTVLYDAAGKEVARVIGAMDWHGAEGRKLINEALRGA